MFNIESHKGQGTWVPEAGDWSQPRDIEAGDWSQPRDIDVGDWSQPRDIKAGDWSQPRDIEAGDWSQPRDIEAGDTQSLPLPAVTHYNQKSSGAMHKWDFPASTPAQSGQT